MNLSLFAFINKMVACIGSLKTRVSVQIYFDLFCFFTLL